MGLAETLTGKLLGSLWEPLKKNFPRVYTAYKATVTVNKRDVVGCLLSITQEERMLNEQVERLMYLIHRIYYRSGLTTQVDFVIGYPCSIDFDRTYPTKYLIQDIKDSAINYVDKRYFLSLDEPEARERMLNCLENRFTSLLGRTEISGATCYVLLIALGACCGGRFEPDIYKLCVETLVSVINTLNIDPQWTAEKSEDLISMVSCLLPSSRQAGNFTTVVSDMLRNCEVNDSTSAAIVVYNELNNQLGG